MSTTEERIPECVVCGEERPTWPTLQFSSFDADAGAFTHGCFPICGRCLPRCPTCGSPVPTALTEERVAEINKTGTYTTVSWVFEPCVDTDHERPAIETYPRDPRLPLFGPPEPPTEIPGYSFLIARLEHVGIGDYVAVDGVEGIGRVHYIMSSRRGGGIWLRVGYPDGRSYSKRASDVHVVDDSGRVVPTSPADELHDTPVVEPGEPEDPFVVIERCIDRCFGDGYLPTVLSEAIAEGIECLRAANGTLDGAAVIRVLAECGLGNELASPLLEAETRTDLEWVVHDALEHSYLLDEVIELLVGSVEQIGGCDSSSFAVMTAGHVTTNVVIRNDEFTTFDNGSEEGFDFYWMSGRTRVADDTDLKNARLDVARLMGGLRPGVWISDAEEIDDELREMTYLGFDFGEAVQRAGVEVLVEEWALRFLTTAGLTEDNAQARVRALLLEDASPENEAEERLVWDVWKDIRPQ